MDRFSCAISVMLFLLLAPAAPDVHAERPSGAPEDWPAPIHDSQIHSFVLLNRLETGQDGDAVTWDGVSWIGGDVNRLWFESEGEVVTDGEGGELEGFDVEYGRLITPFWDFQAGIGYQRSWVAGAPDAGRVYALIGVQGLAPYRFEVDLNLRVSGDGDVWGDLEAEYDVLLTQRWVLQCRLETAAALQAAEAFEMGEGLNSLRLGSRLRYEFRRELAPYVGISWKRLFAATADLARADGNGTAEVQMVAGLRLWF